jgi:phosphoribosylamine-glycine ligase
VTFLNISGGDMTFWRYGYTNKEGKAKNMLVEAATRRKADAAFVARSGVFEAGVVEEVPEEKIQTTSPDPKKSTCRIVKYNKLDPKKFEVVESGIKGQAAALRKLHKLQKEEPRKDKFAYYWQFEDVPIKK